MINECESNMQPITICHDKSIVTKTMSVYTCDFRRPLLEFDMIFLFICEVQFNFCDWVKLFDCLDQPQLKDNSIQAGLDYLLQLYQCFFFFFLEDADILDDCITSIVGAYLLFGEVQNLLN